MVEIGEAMETKTKQLDAQKTQQQNGSGSLLAEARKKQKRTVEEIADELNLSVSQIKTIELDQNEGLPEPTYVRGYIRSYAKLLGLDAERVLESYLNPNWQKTSSLDDMPKGIGNADEGVVGGFLTPGKLISGLFIILIVAFLWFSGLLSNFITKDDSLTSGSVSQTVEVVSNASDLVDELPVPNAVDSFVEQQDVVVEQNEVAVEPVETTVVNVEEPEVSEEPVNQLSHSLTLTFEQTCWVDIRDNKDKKLVFKSYYAGEELTVTNEGRLHVFLGNAEGVAATYNGESFDMAPYREGVYAKFSLDKK